MTRILWVLLISCPSMFLMDAARANESVFLQSLQGKWAGKGVVKLRTNSLPVKVACRFDSSATESSLSLDGNCRGLIVVSRSIGADLKFNGTTYTGSYTGSRSGTAALAGSRQDDAINLNIRWAKEINGDLDAKLLVRKVGDNGMRLTTIDVDPQSGKAVVTSEINLTRQ